MKKFNVEGNLHFYNLMLQTCANERDEENALKIFQRTYAAQWRFDTYFDTTFSLIGIKDERLKPDQSTFSSMMSLYENDEQRHREFDEEKMTLYWKFMTNWGLKPGTGQWH